MTGSSNLILIDAAADTFAGRINNLSLGIKHTQLIPTTIPLVKQIKVSYL